MIWNSAYLDPRLNKVPNIIYDKVVNENQLSIGDSDAIYIVVIGGGPKGFYAIERFISKTAQNHIDNNRSIHIHWYNHNKDFASGPNFHPNIPPYLIMNDCIAEINCWEENDNSILTGKLTLLDWMIKNKSVEEVPQQADYCSRELFGLYLMEALKITLENKPDFITISLISADIIDLDLVNDSIQLTSSKQKIPFLYESAILCTGHYHSNNVEEDFLNQMYLYKIFYLPNPYSTELLDEIPSQANVAVNGVGLTFMDTVLQLTEGRGGIFYKQDQEYKYLPSGYEPIIYPFAKRNLPQLPRNTFWKGNKYCLKLMTDDWVNLLKNRQEPLNFERDILPTYNLETQLAFYTYVNSTKEFTDSEILDFIDSFDASKLFSINALIDPMTFSQVQMETNYNEFIIDLSIYTLKLSDQGELKSPISAALAALREGFYKITELFASNDFDEESHELFEKHWLEFIYHSAFGPSRDSMDKLFCLIREGYVKFYYSEEPSLIVGRDTISIKNDFVEKEFKYFINAKDAEENFQIQTNKLFQNMYKKGLLQEIKNGKYKNGKIAVNIDGSLINNFKNIIIYLYGIPANGKYLQYNHLSRSHYNFSNNWHQATLNKISKKNITQKTYSLRCLETNYINLTSY